MITFLEYTVILIVSIPAGFLLAALPYLLSTWLIRKVFTSSWKTRLMLSPFLEFFCGLGTVIALIFIPRFFHLIPNVVTVIILIFFAFFYFNSFKPSNVAMLDNLNVPYDHRRYLFGFRAFLAWLSWTTGLVLGWSIIITRLS
jgi:hypothetical protein